MGSTWTRPFLQQASVALPSGDPKKWLITALAPVTPALQESFAREGPRLGWGGRHQGSRSCDPSVSHPLPHSSEGPSVQWALRPQHPACFLGQCKAPPFSPSHPGRGGGGAKTSSGTVRTGDSSRALLADTRGTAVPAPTDRHTPKTVDYLRTLPSSQPPSQGDQSLQGPLGRQAGPEVPSASEWAKPETPRLAGLTLVCPDM